MSNYKQSDNIVSDKDLGRDNKNIENQDPKRNNALNRGEIQASEQFKNKDEIQSSNDNVNSSIKRDDTRERQNYPGQDRPLEQNLNQ
jgi:hypothetical protein